MKMLSFLCYAFDLLGIATSYNWFQVKNHLRHLTNATFFDPLIGLQLLGLPNFLKILLYFIFELTKVPYERTFILLNNYIN